jgi:hypothetical protein
MRTARKPWRFTFALWAAKSTTSAFGNTLAAGLLNIDNSSGDLVACIGRCRARWRPRRGGR